MRFGRLTNVTFICTVALVAAISLLFRKPQEEAPPSNVAEKSPPDAELCFARPSDAVVGLVGTVVPALRPALGQHRPDSDAVFAMAGGYPLETVSQFVGLLLKTGYTGDIVLGTQPLQKCEPMLRDYLIWHAERSNLVVYEVEAVCKRTKCTMNGLYKQHYHVLPDPRKSRYFAWMRYELYWIWSLPYLDAEKSSRNRILLIDSRDVYFQSNPFLVDTLDDAETNNEAAMTLHVYQEIEPIGEQEINASWIRDAYGQDVLDAVGSNIILCSGSTLGGAAAIELYARAMVEENDKDVTCTTRGCDQGHHNYLVHSGSLQQQGCGTPGQDDRIQRVVSHEVGHGAVLTIGSMLAKGRHKEHVVRTEDDDFLYYNTDGTLAPIVHQLDRNEEMFSKVAEKGRLELNTWKLERYGSIE